MNDASMPQCTSTVRLHEMLLDGTLGEHEDRALMADRRLNGKYRGLRSCDKAFNAILNMKTPNINSADSSDTDAKPPQVLYAEYLDCVSGMLCEKSYHEWGTCVELVQKQQQDIRHCARPKRMLERCLRGETEKLLRASQPQVFRPNGSI
ncbi:unnamed protein product [Peronospora effusa]|uniref:Uncharacterized protein n=1 Tax=Peronospora effusa TaxID=542832 RepID=A0A3M6VBY0_9STRA|nr:hypothetical protein DD238_004840 [Peronospora effusa]RQM12584.1 hypothetical protein DD237_005405 [Peronospora effusa]CAI5724005.1 unnamed protein product [Peronospora effusa]